jgi:dihydroflavonol-4-reductase
MRILVTGATGFIGARLLARLAVECDSLRILRRAESSLELIKNIRFEDFIGDVTNRDDVMRAVEGCDYVFHVAASVSYWDKLKKEQYDVNVNGTKNIVEACLTHKVKRLIHTSSIVAIGSPSKGGIADEDTEYNFGHYKISYCDTKRLGELEVQKGVRAGLDAVIVNPAAVFGPGDIRRYKGHLYGGKVWTRLFYVGGGIATVDVDDVVDGHIRAWKKGKVGERYILANENLTFKEIADTIAFALSPQGRGVGDGWFRNRVRIPTALVFTLAYLATFFSILTRTKPVATVSMAKFTKMNLFFSNEKARRDLGMTFRPFSETIERTFEWLKSKS